MSWFWRGFQSAVFYYVACTPCANWDYKRKRQREADRTLAARNALEMTQPGIIHQPVQFTTNPAWAEEISAGPGPPPGWKGHESRRKVRPSTPKRLRAVSPRRLSRSRSRSPKHQSPAPNVTPSSPRERRAKNRANSGSLEETIHNKLHDIKDGLKVVMHPDNWNILSHERPEEILWGQEPLKRMSKGKGREGSHSDPSSPPTRGRSRGNTHFSNTSKDYEYVARHPELNDLHPPIVSLLPRNREEVAWMLQPPPPAAVMEGKVHPSEAPIQPRPEPLTRPPKTPPKPYRRPRLSTIESIDGATSPVNPEWEFLVSMCLPELPKKAVRAVSLRASWQGHEHLSSGRASWHGHERAISEI